MVPQIGLQILEKILEKLQILDYGLTVHYKKQNKIVIQNSLRDELGNNRVKRMPVKQKTI